MATGSFQALPDSMTQVSSMATGAFPMPTGSNLPNQDRPATTITRSPGTDENPSDTNGPLEPGQSFGTRYHIIRLLGIGGMGAVYQAWDSELGVAVAIKVVLPGLGDPGPPPSRASLQNELLARQVTQERRRIPTSANRRYRFYITMSFVEDRTWRRSRGRLPIGRTLGCASVARTGPPVKCRPAI
jgi:serine/threonine protein kinase